MIKADLVTGFLGSGKTSFIEEYAALLVKTGRKLAVIVNDCGAINIDRILLAERLKGLCPVEMVIGGDADCIRRRLASKLIALAMEGYAQVIIEPSGVFDAEEFLDLVYDEKLERFVRPGSIISLVDGNLCRMLGKNARYVLAAQLSKAGAVVLGKGNEGSKEEILACLNGCLREFNCDRSLKKLEIWKKGSLSLKEAEYYDSCSYVSGNIEKRSVTEDGSFEPLFFFNHAVTADNYEERFNRLFKDEEAGRIYRIKGFIKRGEGWLEVNAGADSLEAKASSIGQDVFIVIGEGLDREKITAMFTE